jgi:putative Ca2+/H+ antiporter (TMEM165/GDT1 family)
MSDIVEIFSIIIGTFFVVFGARCLYEAELMNQSKRDAYRAGTHDYYGNKIEKSENNG